MCLGFHMYTSPLSYTSPWATPFAFSPGCHEEESKDDIAPPPALEL